MDRTLSLEFARVVEAAALRSGRLLGRGQKDEADGLAVDAMRQAFDSVRISGTVVIGEGEIDEAPMLYIGEHVGAGGPEVDIAVDPIEGTNLIAKGQNGAIAVMAIAEKGGLLHAPDMYMEKICVGPRGAGAIDITKSLTENIQNVAAKMGRKVDEINLVMLDRERHHGLMKEARDLGARIMLISDGDVNPAMECCIEGSGVHMVVGTGGAPEGVLAAAALKCAGGDMQARLKPGNEEEIRRCHEMGVKDVNQVLTLDDLVRTDDVIFAATAITRGNLLNPIQYFPGGARTHTIVMRSKTGTVRFLDTIHRDEKLTTLKAR
ncbi:class II fructose-bisphosphatase [Veillonella atypica]|jgi:fructose-1,6-bisphosphatase, class II|uniref:class II fructose-bisphosphatase n=1 Tax=Veillonella atypica TaxID=39777 RepID=UPI001CAF70BC|nr:class II fructose-bisphosphatase [Veillonella atypica]MBF1750049.1 class II fructose-bisphosphatase [Veillonella sp.]MDU1048746.1 class II fructose-bisphosphatase [Veillonella sp.]